MSRQTSNVSVEHKKRSRKLAWWQQPSTDSSEWETESDEDGTEVEEETEEEKEEITE